MSVAVEDFIPVFKPVLGDAEHVAVSEALEVGWLGMGSYVAEFEERLSAAIEAEDRHIAAVSTGHAALHLALLLAGVGPGDEVITPAFNNVADFQAIVATGASPVLCDIDDTTLCIDVDAAAALVTPSTKVIIAMDYASALADHAAVTDLADAHGLRVLHDAAHSLGATCLGRRVGSFSDLCMFSFDPVKTITTIDGGALVVRTQDELDALRAMRLMGMRQEPATMYGNARPATYDVEQLGFRYHMSNVHAAIGVAQLERLDEFAESRRAICRGYNAVLADVPDVSVPDADFDEVVPLLYCIRVPAEQRDSLRAHLSERGVDNGIHWKPGHRFTMLRESRRGPLTVTDRVADEILSLPLHPFMPDAWLDRVTDAVRSFFGP